MFGFPPFYNESLRRYTIVFGTLFNDIEIIKHSEDNSVYKTVKVPIAYGPKEKFLARLEGEPDLSIAGSPKQVAIQLPRMSFEILGISYDPDRKLSSSGVIKIPDPANPGQYLAVYNPTPYNIRFQLNVLTRTYDDGPQIIEQILPFFTPEWTNAVNILDQLGVTLDCTLVLNSVENTDTYENDFKTRRVIIWTLDFTMRAWFFGPVKSKKTITVAKSNIYVPPLTVSTGVLAIGYDNSQVNDLIGFGNTAAFFEAASITVQPGLTANGQPTSNAELSIPVDQIAANSDWGYVVTITENGA